MADTIKHRFTAVRGPGKDAWNDTLVVAGGSHGQSMVRDTTATDGWAFKTIAGAAWYDVTNYGATGDYVTDDTAGIQAAIDACPDYGVVYAPAGNYLIYDTIEIDHPITLVGDGHGTIFYAIGIAGTKDLFHVHPQTDGHYFRFRDFSIAPRTGTPCRHAIYVDGEHAYMGDSLFENVQIYALNTTGNAIRFVGNGGDGITGNPAITTIQNCILGGGLYFEQCSDTVRILGNHITGVPAAIDAAFMTGATTMIIEGNSITSQGGCHFGNKTIAAQIIGNEFETTAAFTGSNGAIVDLDGGATTDRATDNIIANNSFQVANGITCDEIRVNYADRTNIYGNRFGRGLTTSKDIVVTANAADTVIGDNQWTVATAFDSLDASYSDAGTRTVFAGVWHGAWWLNKILKLNAGVGGTENEHLRIGRLADDNRYHSLWSVSGSGGAGGDSYLGVLVHDNSQVIKEYYAAQSQAMVWWSNGYCQIGPWHTGSTNVVPQNLLTLKKRDAIDTEPGIDLFATDHADSAAMYNAARIYASFSGSTGYTAARLTVATPTGANTWADVLTARNGKVGIGTTAPSVALDVVGDAKVSGGLNLGAGAVGTPSVTFGTDTNSGFYSVSDNNVGVSCNGVRVAYFGPSAFVVAGAIYVGATDTVLERYLAAGAVGITGPNGASTVLSKSSAQSSAMSGATTTFSNLIPAGSLVLGVTVHPTTAITSGDGGTTYSVGDGTDVDRWGSGIAFASDVTLANITIAGPVYYTSAASVVLTCDGGKTFNAGVTRAIVHYISLVAATS